jgi:diguanylate cyclase (GGDEF)-like protein
MLGTYITTAVIDVIALVLLSGLLRGNYILADYRKKPFIFGILIAILVIISEAGTVLAGSGGPQLRFINLTFNSIGFAFTPFIPISLIAIFDAEVLKNQRILFLPSFMSFAIAAMSPLFGLYFFIDDLNQYSRGPLFPIFVVVYITNILLLFISTVQTGRKYFYPIKRKIITLLIFTVLGTCVQLLFPEILLSWHCVTLTLIMFYLLLQEFDGSFDILTGLYNRTAFEKITKAFHAGEIYYVIVMDINSFKEINDTYGHEYGDSVLKKVAEIIRKSFDGKCSCFRVGGDEFYVLCRYSNQERIKHQLTEMTDRLARERINDSYLPTVAYGYEIYDFSEGRDFSQILKAADEQMYKFKQLQKSNY